MLSLNVFLPNSLLRNECREMIVGMTADVLICFSEIIFPSYVNPKKPAFSTESKFSSRRSNKIAFIRDKIYSPYSIASDEVGM